MTQQTPQPSDFAFDAVAVVAQERGLNLRKAETFLKRHLKAGNITAQDETGHPVTSIGLTNQLAKIEDSRS